MGSEQEQPAPSENGGLDLGTFIGVYTPTVLTILGVILYMRMGWVVANAGVWGTVGIVLLANAITAITALSLSALATNMRVGVGGAYYIISRSLGLELGGALGIPLYLSQALSVTLYAYGLAESLRIIWPGVGGLATRGLTWLFERHEGLEASGLGGWLHEVALGLSDGGPPVQWVAATIVLSVVLVAARSTVLALKMQLPIMGLIAISLMSLVVGVGWGPAQVPAVGPWTDASFWPVFAVFFPAVTGVLAGVGLSGDLKDPAKSIPKGVLFAVLTGFIVYMAMPFILSRAGGPGTLSDPLLWTKVAWVGAAVMPGLWGAILSSAIGSILGAPRTLQALAQDRLAPAWIARLDPVSGEPMVALRISGLVALGAVALGDLNVVASVVSMFFLTTYGMLNLAAALEDLVKDPSYRPQIRIPWFVSLAGAVGCFIAMFAINPLAFLAAVVIEFIIWWVLRRRSLEATWGDLRSGLWMALVRFSMVQLRTANVDARNWRPHILFFTADLERNLACVRMASNFSQDHGLVTVSTLLLGDMERRPEARALQDRCQMRLDEERVLAFSEVVVVPDLESGFMSVAQAHGIGGVDSNMVAFGWPGRDPQLIAAMLQRVRHLAGLDKSVMWMRPVPGGRQPGAGRILVWWAGKEQNGDMMLLLAHLLSVDDDWRSARITLCSVVPDEETATARVAQVESGLADTRIQAEVEAVIQPPDRSVTEVIHERSRGSDLVFLGLPLVAAGQEESAAGRLLALVDGQPSTILVRSAGPFRGRLV
ncbi:MAG: Na-K-Cl cotransporter [Myxococcota bacterium]|nr:Na-K-Cl cotransporter [Myxococcota bacterium]